jgi:hypothetical protein
MGVDGQGGEAAAEVAVGTPGGRRHCRETASAVHPDRFVGVGGGGKLDGGIGVGVADGGVHRESNSVPLLEETVDLLEKRKRFRLPRDAVLDVFQRFLGRKLGLSEKMRRNAREKLRAQLYDSPARCNSKHFARRWSSSS